MSQGTITVSSGVGFKSGEGFVAVHWRDQSAQLSTQEAKEFGMHIIEAAVAAEGDAALMKVIGLPVDNVGLSLMAAMRHERSGDEKVSGRAQAELEDIPE